MLFAIGRSCGRLAVTGLVPAAQTPLGPCGSVAVGISPDVTIPITMLPRLQSDEQNALVRAGSFWLNIMGRVRPGLSIAQADAAFQPVWTQALAATVAAPAVPIVLAASQPPR